MIRILVLLFLLLLPTSAVLADVELQVNGKFKLDSAPVDITSSADGQRIFALLEGGKLQVFDARGRLQETLDLGLAADKIQVSPEGDRLILSKGKEVQLVSLDYIKLIDLAGSPFKGPADAKVVVAVYSDFQ